MTNQKILDLIPGLRAVDAPGMDPDFNYNVSETLAAAVDLSTHIIKAIEPTTKMEEYNDKANTLRVEYAAKDKEGNPIHSMRPGGIKDYIIPGSELPTCEFRVKLKALEDEYAKEIEAHKEKLKYLEQENKKFKPSWIKKSTIPEGLSRRAMNAVFMISKK